MTAYRVKKHQRSLLFSHALQLLSISISCLIGLSFVSPIIADSTKPTANISPAATPSALNQKAPESLLLDIAGIEDVIIAVGQRGHILRSEDGGEHFRAQSSGTTTTLTSIAFITPEVVVAAGHQLTLLFSRDSGKTWEQSQHDTEDSAPWLDLLTLDEQRVIAVGAYGHLGISNDQGKTWSIGLPTGEDYHLNSIARIDKSTLIIAGEAGRVYRSSDLGITWNTIHTPHEGSFFAIQALSTYKFLLLGLRGTALLGDISSAEVKWTQLTLPAKTDQSWFGLSAPTPSHSMWLAGGAGQLFQLHSVDSMTKPGWTPYSKLTFSAESLNRPDRADIAQVLHHKKTLWTVGQNGLKKYKISAYSAINRYKTVISEKPYVFLHNNGTTHP